MTITNLQFRARPRTYTAAEQVIEFLAEQIITDGRTYTEIAAAVGVSKSTINNLAMRKTRWPRPNTLFPLLNHFGVEISLSKRSA